MDQSEQWVAGGDGDIQTTGGDTVVIGHFGCGLNWRDEADKRLALAAPDLLAACQAAIDAAVEYGGRHGDYSLASQLDIAIRKATGKE